MKSPLLVAVLAVACGAKFTPEQEQALKDLGENELVRLKGLEERIEHLPYHVQRRKIAEYIKQIPRETLERYELAKATRNVARTKRLRKMKADLVKMLGPKRFGRMMVILHDARLSRRARVIRAGRMARKFRSAKSRRFANSFIRQEIPPGVN